MFVHSSNIHASMLTRFMIACIIKPSKQLHHTGGRRAMGVYEYDVTYEMQNGERHTCIVTQYNLVKAAQQADRLLREYHSDYKMLVEVKEHIYD